MKVSIYTIDGKVKGSLELPKIFLEAIRTDLIKRAVLSEKSKKRQPYGTDPMAGKRTSAHYHGRRHTRWGMMNREMARMKRLHDQGPLNYRARFVPQAIKGRKAHPPKAEKVWEEKINKKEKLKALFSAIAATANKELIVKRGHKLNGIKELPLILETNFENLKKAKDVTKVLELLGLKEELERVKEKKERAGKGKRRGRKYKKKKGPLIVVGGENDIIKAAKNIEGVDVVPVKKLNVELLAPGTHPGRLTIWSESAIKELEKIIS